MSLFVRIVDHKTEVELPRIYATEPWGYGAVPASELALHCRIAGLPIKRYAVFPGGTAVVELSESYTVTGLVSELVPYALRGGK